MLNHKTIKSLEIVPTIGFGAAYFYTRDFQKATLALAVLMTAYVALVRLTGHKLTKLQSTMWLITVVLAGVSLLTGNSDIFKWKVTVINTLLAFVFLFSHFLGRQTILERFVSEHLQGAERKLRRLNCVAVGYFLFVAVLNLFVVKYFDHEVWVKFKLFGLLGMNIAFLMICLIYLKEEIQEFTQKKQ